MIMGDFRDQDGKPEQQRPRRRLLPPCNSTAEVRGASKPPQNSGSKYRLPLSTAELADEVQSLAASAAEAAAELAVLI